MRRISIHFARDDLAFPKWWRIKSPTFQSILLLTLCFVLDSLLLDILACWTLTPLRGFTIFLSPLCALASLLLVRRLSRTFFPRSFLLLRLAFLTPGLVDLLVARLPRDTASERDGDSLDSSDCSLSSSLCGNKQNLKTFFCHVSPYKQNKIFGLTIWARRV